MHIYITPTTIHFSEVLCELLEARKVSLIIDPEALRMFTFVPAKDDDRQGLVWNSKPQKAPMLVALLYEAFGWSKDNEYRIPIMDDDSDEAVFEGKYRILFDSHQAEYSPLK